MLHLLGFLLIETGGSKIRLGFRTSQSHKKTSGHKSASCNLIKIAEIPHLYKDVQPSR
jgi:hypothetical protein